MKKLTLLILVITIAASSFAQTKNMDITTVKKIYTSEVVTTLKVYNNVEVILTTDSISGIQVVGEKLTVENTMVKIVNGELIITNASPDFCEEKVVVYVPSVNLARVYIHGASSLSSLQVLDNEMLDVTINGEARSTIKTTGKISLNTIGDFPLDLSVM